MLYEISPLEGYGNPSDIILQVSEGDIFDGSITTDLLAGVTPTGSATGFGTSLEDFNDEVDDQSLGGLYHSVQDTDFKKIEVLGTTALSFPSGTIRIRIVGRDSERSRNNAYEVSLLGANGDSIGTSADLPSGFEKNNRAHDGFVVDFDAVTGAVISQPRIFDLDASLPPLVENAIPDETQAIGYASFTVDLSDVFTENALTFTAVSDDTSLATVAVSGTTLTVTEVSGLGAATITITADDGNGGTVDDEFILTVTSFEVFGYRVTASTPNRGSNIILQASEGDIFDGNSTTDLLARITPTGSPEGFINLGTSFRDFNNELDNQTFSGVYHSQDNTAVKMIQVLGTTALEFPSGTIRIRIVGRNEAQSRNNGYVVTLLGVNGNSIGTRSNLVSGFEDENEAHDGFTVDFDAVTGAVISQPRIFDLNTSLSNGSLPPVNPTATVLRISMNGNTRNSSTALTEIQLFNNDQLVSLNTELITGTASISGQPISALFDGEVSFDLGDVALFFELSPPTSIAYNLGDNYTFDEVRLHSIETVNYLDVTVEVSNDNGITYTFIGTQDVFENASFSVSPSAPTVENAIADVTQGEGYGSFTVDLSNVFIDVDTDDNALTFTAESDNTGLAMIAVSETTLTVTEVSGLGTATITVTADDGDGGTVDDDFTLTIMDLGGKLPIFGYRVTASTVNAGGASSNILLQVSEGDILDGSGTTDLLAEVTSTGSATAFGTSLEDFNDELDDQAITGLYHSEESSDVKMIQVLGTTALAFPNGKVRIRIVGRNAIQSRNNGLVVTLLDSRGEPIGIPSDAASGFEDGNLAHDGFIVDFDAVTGAVISQPTILDLNTFLPNGSLPPVNPTATVLRITMNGNTINSRNDLVEIELFNNDELILLNTELITGTASMSGEPISVLFDGGVNAGSFISFGNAFPTTIVHNLGESYTFDEVRLHVFDGAGASPIYQDVTVEVSNDNGVTYTPISTQNVVNNASFSTRLLAPRIVREIADESQTEGYGSFILDLTDVFTSNGEALTYTAESSDTALATVTVSGATLIVTEVSGVGMATITVTVNNGNSSAVDDFILTVNNQAPRVANAIADKAQEEGYGGFTLDLRNVFTDVNAEALTYTAESSDTALTTVKVSGTTLTVTEVSGVGMAIITVTADDGNGGTVSEVFTLTVVDSDSRLPVFGYRVTASTVNSSGSSIVLQVSEGDIFNGNSTTDLLAGVTPTGSPIGVAVTSFANFNDGEDNQAIAGLYHSQQSIEVKEIEVLGTTALAFSNGTIRIRIVGRDTERSRNNGLVVTLLDVNGDPIGTPSDAASGFENDSTHDGFVVDFDVVTGIVTRQPTIFDLDSSLPSLATTALPRVVNAIANTTQLIGYDSFMVDLSNVFADPDDVLTFIAESSDTALTTLTVFGTTLTVTEVSGVGTAVITVTADDGNGGTVSEAFTLTVVDSDSRLPIFGYRVTASTANGSGSSSEITLQVSEGDIFDGDNTIDLLAGVTPTGSAANFGTSFEDFNNELDNQSLAGLYHSAQNSAVKMIEVLGTTALSFPSGKVRIRIVGRNFAQSRNNVYEVTLLDANGDPIGTPSDAASGFKDNNGTHDGFIVDFDARTGAVTQQPRIFDLNTSLPNGSLPSVDLTATVLRITMNGNTVNSSNDLVEIQLFNNDEFVPLNTELITGTAGDNGKSTRVLFDGEINAGTFSTFGNASPTTIIYNLGENYTFDEVRLHVFNGDNRIYLDVTVEESNDNGITYTPISTQNVFDNASFSLTPLAPRIVRAFADTIQARGYRSFTIDLRNVFTDPNGDALTFTAESDNTDLATVAVSGTTLTVTEVNETGTTVITVTAENGNGDTVEDDFILTVRILEVFGYRVTTSTPNSGSDIALQVSEGDIFDGDSTTDLLAGVTPTGSTAGFGTSFDNFNDESDSQTINDIYHSLQNSSVKMLQVLRPTALAFSSGTIRIRIVGRDTERSRNNGLVVTLLDVNGDPIGTPSDAASGFENDSTHDGFVVDFDVVTGRVTRQPTIFDLDGSLPFVGPQLTVASAIADVTQTETYNSFTVDLSNVFTDANGDILTFTAVSSDTALVMVTVSGTTLTVSEVSGMGTATITVTADNGNGGTVDDAFTLTVVADFSIANQGLLAGRSIQETINAQNITSLAGESFETSNLIFAGGFNSSKSSGLLYESGGSGTGTTIGLINNAFIVSAGEGNNIDALVTGLLPNKNYVYIVQILPGDRIDIWLQEGVTTSSITGVANATGIITADNVDGSNEPGYLTTGGGSVQFTLPNFAGYATEILLFVNQLEL